MTRLEELLKLVQIEPGDALSHYGLGLEYLNLRRWDEAAAAFARAAQLDPKYSVAYYHRARAEIGAGRNDAARATLTDGVEVARRAGDWHAQGEMQDLLDTLE